MQARTTLEHALRWNVSGERCGTGLDHLSPVASTYDVQVRLLAGLRERYHQAPHAGLLGRTPAKVWAKRKLTVRDEAQLADALTVYETRRVRGECTLTVGNVDWKLAEGFLSGRKVTVARTLADPQCAPWVEHDDRAYALRPVDAVANGRRKRRPKPGIDAVGFDPVQRAARPRHGPSSQEGRCAMRKPAWLRNFGLSASPFSKDLPDDDLWLPNSRKQVVDDLVDATHERHHAIVGEPGVSPRPPRPFLWGQMSVHSPPSLSGPRLVGLRGLRSGPVPRGGLLSAPRVLEGKLNRQIRRREARPTIAAPEHDSVPLILDHHPSVSQPGIGAPMGAAPAIPHPQLGVAPLGGRHKNAAVLWRRVGPKHNFSCAHSLNRELTTVELHANALHWRRLPGSQSHADRGSGIHASTIDPMNKFITNLLWCTLIARKALCQCFGHPGS